MKKHHIVLSVVGIFAVASVLPGNALAEDTPRQPLKELRMEWREGRADNKAEWKEMRGEHKDAFNVLKEERKDMRAEWKETTKEDRVFFKQRLASSTDAIRARFLGAKKMTVAERVETMYNRFDTTLLRLSAVADRIETRIEAMEADDQDTARAKDALEDAREAIEDAQEVVAETEAAIDEVLEDEDEISKEGLRELVQKAKTAIKTAHTELIEVVQILKEASNE